MKKEKKSHLNLWIYVIITVCILSSSIAYSALNASVKITGDVVIEKPKADGTLYMKIKESAVMDNIQSDYVSSSTGINFEAKSSDTNGKGVYELHTTKDDEYPIYYYRGAVTDNNVIFAEYCWKIIRTTETGGVKLIYNGKPSDDGKCTNTTGTNTQLLTSAYNNSDNNAKYVGYKYDNDTVTSAIKTKVEDWYKTNIDEKKDNNEISYTNYLEDNIFCNDRSITSQTGSLIYYGSYKRNYENKMPNLECPQEDDKFMVANKKLTYPVGLITIDEVSYAGGVYNITNDTYYLYTNQLYWTMSPYSFSNYAYVWDVGANGNLSSNYVFLSYGVRPVISLKQGTKYSSGNGSKETPFIITPVKTVQPSLPEEQEKKILFNEIKSNSVLDNIKSEYVESNNGIDFHSGSSNTNGKGIYELHTTKNNDYPIYYYRGVVDNNIIFANFCWKIIRTTEIGGIRIIYNGKPTNNKCNNTGTETQIGTQAYNSNSNQAQYVGYKYDNDTKDSTIKTKVDSWYEENIKNNRNSKGKSYSMYLDDSFFCNDRSSRILGSNIYYGAYDRNYYNENRTPSLECNENDKFTVANQKLKYPVGLITLDEVAYAGGEYHDTTSGYYLLTGSNYWTMSPSFFYGGYAYVWNVSSNGVFLDYNVYGGYGVRPVVNLTSNTQVTGEGTPDNPYKIIE